jgi:hypothetical protein
MHPHGSPPRARKDGLLVKELGEELLLYDRDSHIAHCLSPIAACVWRHCDGEHDLTDLAGLAGASESLVADALHELREKDLVAAEPAPMPSTVPGESRREAIVRVARYGAAAAAGSMIVSATAATPAMASSGAVLWGFSPTELKWGSKEKTCKKLEIKEAGDAVMLISQKTTDETDFEVKDPNKCFGKSFVAPCTIEVCRKTNTVTGLKFWEFEYEDETTKTKSNEPKAVDLEGN